MIEDCVNKITDTESRGAIAPLFLYPLVIGAGVVLSQFAFSKKSRRAIVERDGGCQWDDEYTQHEGGLEAAHYDHDRKKKNYDDPRSGRLLCTAHHLEDHIINEGRNGLTHAQNEYAKKSLLARLLGL